MDVTVLSYSFLTGYQIPKHFVETLADASYGTGSQQSITSKSRDSMAEITSEVGRVALNANRVNDIADLPKSRSISRLSSSMDAFGSQTFSQGFLETLLSSQMRAFEMLHFQEFHGRIKEFGDLEESPQQTHIVDFIHEICSSRVSCRDDYVSVVENLYQRTLESLMQIKDISDIFKRLLCLGRTMWNLQARGICLSALLKIKTDYRPEFLEALGSSIIAACTNTSQRFNRQKYPNVLHSEFDEQIYSKPNCLGPQTNTLASFDRGNPYINNESNLPNLIVFVHGFLGSAFDLRSHSNQVCQLYSYYRGNTQIFFPVHL